MRRGKLEPLLVSTLPLGSDRRVRVTYHAAACALFALLALVFNVFVLGDFYRLWFSGHVVTAQALSGRIEEAHVPASRGATRRVVTHFVTFEYSDSAGVKQASELEVPAYIYEATWKSPRMEMPVRVTAAPSRIIQIGARPRAPDSALIVGIASILFALGYGWGMHALRPWYDRRRLNETENGRMPVVLSRSRPAPAAPPVRVPLPSAAPGDAATVELEAESDALALEPQRSPAARLESE